MKIASIHGVEAMRHAASGGGGSRRDGLCSTALEWNTCRVLLAARYERVGLDSDRGSIGLKKRGK